jgi:hypothetical protein
VRAFAVLGNLTKDERLAPFAMGAGAVATMLQHHDRKNAAELEGVVKVCLRMSAHFSSPSRQYGADCALSCCDAGARRSSFYLLFVAAGIACTCSCRDSSSLSPLMLCCMSLARDASKPASPWQGPWQETMPGLCLSL